jgi:Cys-tRNA(Pro)/Cys-tRNA(Cys) deacylase
LGRKRARADSSTTPAVALLQREDVGHRIHEYEHDPRAESYGLEAAEALGVEPARVFKTLLVALDGDDRRLAVAILPVADQLALKRAAGALGARSAVMADVKRAERVTGYVAGGISPLAQRTSLPTVVDASAFEHETVFVSGGRRGLEIELAPAALQHLTAAVRAELRVGR